MANYPVKHFDFGMGDIYDIGGNTKGYLLKVGLDTDSNSLPYAFQFLANTASIPANVYTIKLYELPSYTEITTPYNLIDLIGSGSPVYALLCGSPATITILSASIIVLQSHFSREDINSRTNSQIIPNGIHYGYTVVLSSTGSIVANQSKIYTNYNFSEYAEYEPFTTISDTDGSFISGDNLTINNFFSIPKIIMNGKCYSPIDYYATDDTDVFDTSLPSFKSLLINKATTINARINIHFRFKLTLGIGERYVILTRGITNTHSLYPYYVSGSPFTVTVETI